MADVADARPVRRSRKPAAPTIVAATPGEILALANDVTSNVLVERGNEMRGVTLAALAGKNLHQLGPAGTAKSLGLREYCKRIVGARYFEKSLHPQMPADAVIGGYDMPRFAREAVFERNVTGKLPTAHVGFVDEITRSNGAMQDALLPLMNTTERLYEVNGHQVRSDLLFLATASNFMPDADDAQAGAFVDRFTLMQYVEYVKADDSFMEIIRRDQARRAGGTMATVTLEQFQGAQAQVRAVDATNIEFLEAAANLRRRTREEGLRVSDRRWVELIEVARASAWIAGRDHCVPEDLAATEAGLWRDPNERPTAHELVLPFYNRFERDAAKFRTESERHVQALKDLRPQVEGTPPSEPLDAELNRGVTNANRGLKLTNQRVEEALADAQREHSDAPALRELHAEIQAWRAWLDDQGFSTRW